MRLNWCLYRRLTTDGKLTYKCDVDVVVPVDTGQDFRQRLRKVFATFVSQSPDRFLLLFVVVVHRISLNHLLESSQVFLRHRVWVKLQQYNIISTNTQTPKFITDCRTLSYMVTDR